MKIFMVDGHCLPKDGGAIIPFSEWGNQYNESKLIRIVTPKIVSLLKSNTSYDVIHFNMDGKGSKTQLYEKARAINAVSTSNKDFAIEIHFNYATNQQSGFFPIIGNNLQLGRSIYDNFNIPGIIRKGIYCTKPYYDRYVKNNVPNIVWLDKKSLGFIKNINISSMIIESLFLSSKSDMTWLFSDLDKNTGLLAQNIYNGIVAYAKSIS